MKRALIVLIILVLAYVAVRITLDRAGARIAADYLARIQKDVAAEHARTAALRFPPSVAGDASDANAADALWPLFERAASWADLRGDVVPLGVTPGEPLSATISAILAAHRSDLDELRTALRATRCDWRVEIEKGVNAKLPNAQGARRAGNLLLAAAIESEARGDSPSAAARCMAAVRLGAMVGAATSIMQVMTGAAMDTQAERTLAHLLTSPAGAGMPLEAIDAQLAALEPLFTGPGQALLGERLSIEASLIQFASGKDSGAIVPLLQSLTDAGSARDTARLILIPVRYEIALAAVDLDERYTSFAKDLGTLDRAAVDARVAAYVAAIDGSWNPIVRMAMINPEGILRRGVHAHERLTRATIAVERRRGADGLYPAKIDEKDLLEDPLARPAKLRYEALDDGRGYRIASAGDDGKPGTSDDIVVERAPER